MNKRLNIQLPPNADCMMDVSNLNKKNNTIFDQRNILVELELEAAK